MFFIAVAWPSPFLDGNLPVPDFIYRWARNKKGVWVLIKPGLKIFVNLSKVILAL
jgi:hypothetical protein